MSRIDQKSTNPQVIKSKWSTGFLADYIDEAMVVNDPQNKRGIYLYKKLKEKLKLKSNNYERELDIFISSAENDDLSALLHKLLPRSKSNG